MSVEIKTIDSENVEVNGKLVYKDHNENWVAKVELTTQEASAFNNHLQALKRQPKG